MVETRIDGELNEIRSRLMEREERLVAQEARMEAHDVRFARMEAMLISLSETVEHLALASNSRAQDYQDVVIPKISSSSLIFERSINQLMNLKYMTDSDDISVYSVPKPTEPASIAQPISNDEPSPMIVLPNGLSQEIIKEPDKSLYTSTLVVGVYPSIPKWGQFEEPRKLPPLRVQDHQKGTTPHVFVLSDFFQLFTIETNTCKLESAFKNRILYWWIIMDDDENMNKDNRKPLKEGWKEVYWDSGALVNYKKLRQAYHWNGMERDVREFVRNRFECQQQKWETTRPKEQHVIEFIFAATEDAIYVHVLISARHIRALSSGDMERILGHLLNHSNQNLPVIVSPHGMRGKLTGCCPSDLVKQVYPSSGKVKSSNGIVGLPNYRCQFYNCQLRGKNCYLEVTLGCPRTGNNKEVQSNVNLKKLHNIKESSAVSRLVDSGRTFIYPPEAVLVPVLQMSSARSYLKRFWLQNWVGPSLSGLYFFRNSAGEVDFSDGSFSKPNGTFSNHDYHSSSNSNNSSINNICSTASDSDYNMTAGGDDLEADAGSLTYGRSGVSSDDQLQRDSLKMGLKRGRAGMNESFGQTGTATDVPVPVQCEVVSNWDWEDDRGGIMDIQVLFSEFGDFRDFFENESLPFGEPPGTAESQALMFSIPDCGDVGSSPCTGIMDDGDQISLPVGFQSLDNFTVPPPMEEHSNKNQEVVKVSVSSDQDHNLPASFNSEFANLLKAEAQISFAPEYGAVEAITSEASTSIFKSPYVPKSRQVDGADSRPKSNVYRATPPYYSSLQGSDEKSDISTNLKGCTGRSDVSSVITSRKYYTLVGSGKEKNEGKNIPCHKSSIGQYLFRWSNALEEDATWEDESFLAQEFPDFVHTWSTQAEAFSLARGRARVEGEATDTMEN